MARKTKQCSANQIDEDKLYIISGEELRKILKEVSARKRYELEIEFADEMDAAKTVAMADCE